MWSYLSNNELENNNYYLVPLENVNDNLSLTSMTSILNDNSQSNGNNFMLLILDSIQPMMLFLHSKIPQMI